MMAVPHSNLTGLNDDFLATTTDRRRLPIGTIKTVSYTHLTLPTTPYV